MTFSLSGGNANENVTWRSKFALHDFFIPIRSTYTMNYQVTEQLRNAFKFKKMNDYSYVLIFSTSLLISPFYVVLWTSTAKKCTKIYNAYTYTLLFYDVLVVVAVIAS